MPWEQLYTGILNQSLFSWLAGIHELINSLLISGHLMHHSPCRRAIYHPFHTAARLQVTIPVAIIGVSIVLST
jgi:hypothetical protein